MSKFLKSVLQKLFPFLETRRERPLPPDSLNLEHNRELWDLYARTWNKEEVAIQDPKVSDGERESYLQCLGNEWGRLSDVEEIIGEYVYPYVSKDSVVAEIGVGGGRIAFRVADRVKELWCFDISSEMLEKARGALAGLENVRYVLLEAPGFPEGMDDKFDFVYAFDVFVHLDLHMMWKYFRGIRAVLKDGGRAFVHTTNLKAPRGWTSFSSQEEYKVIRHYFISPEIVDILADHSDLRVVKRSQIDESNFYLGRDHLVILEKR